MIPEIFLHKNVTISVEDYLKDFSLESEQDTVPPSDSQSTPQITTPAEFFFDIEMQDPIVRFNGYQLVMDPENSDGSDGLDNRQDSDSN